ncbi:hypothetical protein AUP07_0355 [methanogenic archaeon mixed culture ISO4-G1]|nr:hypothetical protein AUP07_0355 [methanogenic archaeon mixed culture ISO4-G1]
MVTDEEISKFVGENRELIERIMKIQQESARETARLAKEMAEGAVDSTKVAAERAAKKSEEFFKATFETITNPVVQEHFLTAGLELIAGLSAMAEIAPIPDFMKEAAGDFEKEARKAACNANKDCPAKTKKVKVKDPDSKCAE